MLLTVGKNRQRAPALDFRGKKDRKAPAVLLKKA